MTASKQEDISKLYQLSALPSTADTTSTDADIPDPDLAQFTVNNEEMQHVMELMLGEQ